LDTKFKSLLEEISNYAPKKSVEDFLDLRVQNLVASAQHVFKMISENYDEETADDLTRRLINSIRTGDENKFRRKTAQIREARTKKGKTL
jgi:hypothetical protein